MDPVILSTLANWLRVQSGLVLTPDKAYLVTSRLQPVAEQHGLKTIEELVRRVTTSPTPALKQDVIEAMTTNETSFFRDSTPFENFKNFVLPQVVERRKARRSLRILCAAASSGQEPYSLAMILAENAALLAGWQTEILGVDLDTKILKRAADAVYTQFEVQRGLPVQMLMKYFDKADQSWRLKPIVRNLVKFRQSNLLQPFSDLGMFDVIFCRNVLIYFDGPTKKNVLERLGAQLAPDGFLFLGGAETVLDITDRFAPSPGQRGVYLPQSSAKSLRAAG